MTDTTNFGGYLTKVLDQSSISDTPLLETSIKATCQKVLSTSRDQYVL